MVDHVRIAQKILKAETAPAWLRGRDEWAALRSIVGAWLDAFVPKEPAPELPKTAPDVDPVQLSDAMMEELEALHMGKEGARKIMVMRALIRRGLVRAGGDLTDSYSLTEDGKKAAARVIEMRRP